MWWAGPVEVGVVVHLVMVVEACRLVRFFLLLCVPAASGATPTEIRGASAHCAGA